MPSKPKYLTPGPGSYDVNSASKIRFDGPRVSSFSNSMCRYDREKTGPLAAATRILTPSPDQYGVQAAAQALNIKIGPGKTKFGSEERKGSMGAASLNPGPGQYANPNMDKVASTTRLREAPKFSFGGLNVRSKSPLATGSTPDAVGPSSYQQGQSVGPQIISRRPTSPTWGMGSASREQTQRVVSPGYNPIPSTNNPGPGNYTVGQSVGRQFLSTAPSSPSYGQGTSDRPAMSAKVLTPGPGMYPVPASIKSQAESRRSTQPAWSFGTSQRPSLEEGLVG